MYIYDFIEDGYGKWTISRTDPFRKIREVVFRDLALYSACNIAYDIKHKGNVANTVNMDHYVELMEKLYRSVRI